MDRRQHGYHRRQPIRKTQQAKTENTSTKHPLKISIQMHKNMAVSTAKASLIHEEKKTYSRSVVHSVNLLTGVGCPTQHNDTWALTDGPPAAAVDAPPPPLPAPTLVNGCPTGGGGLVLDGTALGDAKLRLNAADPLNNKREKKRVFQKQNTKKHDRVYDICIWGGGWGGDAGNIFGRATSAEGLTMTTMDGSVYRIRTARHLLLVAPTILHASTERARQSTLHPTERSGLAQGVPRQQCLQEVLSPSRRQRGYC